ncbi:MAG: hypothetical protein Q3971_07860 [Moraxella sp.]|nr:hypothetical protein [Moraxella sp.]
MNKLILVLSALLLGAGTAHATAFKSPTGNIVCVGDTSVVGGVECHIKSVSRYTTTKPKDCDLDWGHTFFVGRTGRSEVSCHGDVPPSLDASGHRTLAYGKTIRGNGWSCTSAKSGMTCKNQSGHGFKLSKANQRVF